jgi:hypothetical protein
VPLRVKPREKLTPEDIRPELIAPCGMNCGLCMGYLRSQNGCQGCRSGDEGKPKSCLSCSIRTCTTIRDSESGFCFECGRLPCPRLRRLDTRYRAKYRMSMLDNLQNIREQGIDAFVDLERAKWACPECGGMQCVHTPECIYCGHIWAE